MAFALSIVFFLYFWIVGYAVVAALHTQRDLIRNALIAPAVGVVVTIYSVYVLNRLGFPVRSFAQFLALVTLGVAVLALLWRRALLPSRHLVPYLPIAALAFVATGWPLLVGGFAWLGTINADMTYYVFNAHRLVEEAYIQAPNPDVWREQSDWSAYLVIFQIRGVRSGAELLLAWAIVLTGKNGVIVYMPLLTALHVALIAAATGLISTAHRYARILAAILLSSAALLTLGVVFQLVGQVLGLLLLALGSVFCLQPFYRLSRIPLLKFVVLAGITMATLGLTYPEVVPFFGLAFLLYHGLAWNELRRFFGPAVVTVGSIAVIALLLIAPDAWGLMAFLVQQLLASQTSQALPELFPYFLIPSGLAALWGLSPFIPLPGARLVVAIGSAVILSLAAIASSFWLVRHREAAASLTVVMLALAPFLFFADSGFGLLKLAMYAQPFLLPTIVLAFCRLLRVTR